MRPRPPSVRRLPLALLLSWVAVAPAWGQTSDDHLLAGARAFRDGNYERALVEFRVAQRVGAGEQAAWYLAATLQKLGRNEEALEAFLEAEHAWPAGRDTVLTWYEAVASHELGLFAYADRLAARLSAEAGPRLAEQAEKLRRQLQPLLTATPTSAQVDFHLGRIQALKGSRRKLALLHLEEARSLSRRSASCVRCDEVERLSTELSSSAQLSGEG